jgi:CheY-like chemotaxis protein
MAPAKRVLVVDDEEMIRRIVSTILEAEGYRVAAAEEGATALRMIEADRPDLVLLDLRMPGLTGWDVIEQMKTHASPPAVIAMSGMYTEEPAGLRAVQDYVYGYLAKPFTREQMIKSCDRALVFAARASRQDHQAQERRHRLRRDLVVAATLLSSDGTPGALGQILDLSTAGMQLDLGAALNAGTVVTVAFEIPGGHGPFRVSSRIQWRHEAQVGLEFVEMPAEDRFRLAELLGTQT